MPQPPPLGSPPYHYKLEWALPDGVNFDNRPLVFHTVGDVGGIKDPEYQMAVAGAMKTDLNNPDANKRPTFFYILGDIVYYYGEYDLYYDQFYEPYDHYQAPIFAIAGNHDGDIADPSQTSLEGWVNFFMTPAPHIDPNSHDAPRVTMSLPNVYYTLECPYLTMVGMYTNVPEGGSIDSIQQQWLTNEFATAPQDKALILCLHHPVYSFDDHHSGSARMADAVQHAINDSRRVPNMVLAGHVHNYQRIERAITGNSPTPFIVAGHGGYFHMHGMNANDGTTDPQTNATLMVSNHTQHGYLTLTVDPQTISGSMTTVDRTSDSATPNIDTFRYPAGPIFLPSGAIVSL